MDIHSTPSFCGDVDAFTNEELTNRVMASACGQMEGRYIVSDKNIVDKDVMRFQQKFD